MKTFSKPTAIIYIILYVLTLSYSCKEDIKYNFSLKGNTNRLNKGTLLYLEDTLNNKIIDSTLVLNNGFIFSTKNLNFPCKVLLRTKDFSDYRFLWLENNAMTFNDVNKNFRTALVEGSKTESLSYHLSTKTNKLPDNERKDLEVQFIKNHPNSILSVSLLSTYAKTWGKNLTSQLYNIISEDYKKTAYGKRVENYLVHNENIRIGEQFIDFEMLDNKNETQNLSKLRGQLTLLEFWASWCLPCRKENPNLLSTYKKFNPKGFEIVSVSLDSKKANWNKAIQNDNLPWFHLNDLKGEDNLASLIYGVSSLPDNLLIDQNGIIIARNLRGEKLNEKLSDILQ